jgi:TonB family protein
MIQKRKVRNSSNVNLIISAVFHGLLILAIIFFAAREGLIGKRLKQLAVTMVPKEKKPEPPKEKPPEPKIEPPKTPDAPKMSLPPPPAEPPTAAPPPAAVTASPAEAAPAAVSLPSFEFHDGAKEVASISDPNSLYQALVEHAFRANWNRPEDVADDKYVADAEVSVDPSGEVTTYRLLSGSGDRRWDDSVKAALEVTKQLSRPPPKGFPHKFNIRFDVEIVETAPATPLTVQ